MELVLEWFGIVLRVILAGLFALTPGMLVWLAVLSIGLTIRWVGRKAPFQRLSRRGQTA